jgi:uncharacterized YccA/Bax inhibitor family protein
MRTSNPMLNEKVFTAIPYYGQDVMTINGTVNKTGVLLILAVISGCLTWYKATIDPALAAPWMIAGLLGGFIAAMVTVFKKDWAAITAPLYAILEGLALGGISAIFEASYKGIVFMAVMLTFGTLAALLLAYRMGIIRATENFKLGVVAATGGIALYYLVSMVMGFLAQTLR